MRMLLTGGAGFKGCNLTRHLLQKHDMHLVRVIDDLSTGFRETLVCMEAVLIEQSNLDCDTLTRAAAGMDAITSLADQTEPGAYDAALIAVAHVSNTHTTSHAIRSFGKPAASVLDDLAHAQARNGPDIEL